MYESAVDFLKYTYMETTVLNVLGDARGGGGVTKCLPIARRFDSAINIMRRMDFSIFRRSLVPCRL